MVHVLEKGREGGVRPGTLRRGESVGKAGAPARRRAAAGSHLFAKADNVHADVVLLQLLAETLKLRGAERDTGGRRA